jgi:prepilin-type N-terminal cleavage/methylation domain-containing protein
MVKNIFKKNKKGFTLVEVLVSVLIFSVITGSAMQVFIAAVNSQKRILAQQEIIDQTSYAIEYMSRSIRMAKKDVEGVCIEPKLNYENPDGNVSSIVFLKLDQSEEAYFCYRFFLQNDRLMVYKKNLTTSEETVIPLTSTSSIPSVNSLEFYISDYDQYDNLQPSVTIVWDVEGRDGATNQIQTTVSQRNLDLMY